MGDFDVMYSDEQDELTAQVGDATNDHGLYVPDQWTDTSLDHFQSVLITLPAEKRGVKMLKTRFNIIRKHYELLKRDTVGLQMTVDYLNGVRSSGPRKGGLAKAAKTVAEKFFSGMSETLLHKQARLFGLNAAMYDTNEELIQALVERSIAAQAD